MTSAPLARTACFGGLAIAWDERVLEPRPWTIAQPQWLAELSSDAPDGPALELFCGAGQMGLALARLTGRPTVLGDLNPVACDFARANAAAAGLDVDVRHAAVDATARDDERFALMLVDPPWVASADVGVFPDDPTLAIDGGPEGLDLARTALDVIDRHLAPGGQAVLQLGFATQVDDLWRTTSTGLELVAVRDHRPGGVLAHLRAPR
ncbi:methyltransferase domain-containing protein [Solicola sp. PLA-1-18]|uniref:methyltransferase domain-containing protein n=1 Tax=Solicola sp. PLA-1-18 TaxID=3380532 RepID=UPI003B7975EA